MIHELTGPIIPSVLPGVHAVHAVDAAGVHPLLLAIASERYVPDARVRRPQEILTIANALLGQGQLSLAKYLLIVAHEDDPALDIHDIPAFFRHLLERVDWTTDLHFQTRTTIDTLDYSGHGLNQGSKVVIAAAGPVRRDAARRGARRTCASPTASTIPASCCPASWPSRDRLTAERRAGDVASFCRSFGPDDPIRGFPLIVIVDDSEFTARKRTELPLGDLHPLRSRGRHRRNRAVHRQEALGLHRPAGHRRADQAAPRSAAGRRSRRSSGGSTPWPRPAVRCTVSIRLPHGKKPGVSGSPPPTAVTTLRVPERRLTAVSRSGDLPCGCAGRYDPGSQFRTRLSPTVCR